MLAKGQAGLRSYVGFHSHFGEQQRSLKTVAADRIARGTSGSSTRKQVTKCPIGVPRVPYRTPREGSWQWVDIWNCLYRERIIFLSQPVNEVRKEQHACDALNSARFPPLFHTSRVPTISIPSPLYEQTP
jgi:hypothetical protein